MFPYIPGRRKHHGRGVSFILRRQSAGAQPGTMSQLRDEKSTLSDSKDSSVPKVAVDPVFETNEKVFLGGLGDDSPDPTKRGSTDDSEPEYDFKSEEFANIPELVRTVVGFEDDPSLPVLTFRSLLLSALFCTIGSIVSQLS